MNTIAEELFRFHRTFKQTNRNILQLILVRYKISALQRHRVKTALGTLIFCSLESFHKK